MVIDDLKAQLSAHLQDAERLKKPEGVPTGLATLDRFLLWGGFPKGAMSCVIGDLGLGGTSLWLNAATVTTQKQRWVAWMDRESRLFPLPLHHRRLDLGRLLVIEMPEDEKRLAWLLREVMASRLFDLIGCDLGDLRPKVSQLRRLQIQARALNTALVFFCERRTPCDAAMFELVLRFQSRQVIIERALHRPTPSFLPRSVSYASFTANSPTNFGANLINGSGAELSQEPTKVITGRSIAES